jgi:hypothetical protein
MNNLKFSFYFLVMFSMMMSAPAQHVDKDIIKKLETIIPRFKYQGNVVDAFRAIKEETVTSDPTVRGLNIIYQTKETVKEQKSNFINCDFGNMPIGEIIRAICTVNNLKYRIDNAAVVITHSSMHEDAGNAREKIVELKQEIKDLQDQVEELEKVAGKAQSQFPKPDAKVRTKTINKLNTIVIPKIRFEDRDLDFVVDFLKRTSRDLDEDGEGLNIVAGNIKTKKSINLDLDDVSVIDVIRYSCKQLGLNYKVDNYMVILTQKKKE